MKYNYVTKSIFSESILNSIETLYEKFLWKYYISFVDLWMWFRSIFDHYFMYNSKTLKKVFVSEKLCLIILINVRNFRFDYIRKYGCLKNSIFFTKDSYTLPKEI